MLNKLVLYYIERASRKRIDEIICAAMRRKEALFPDWEICYLALPKNDRENRQRILEKMLELEKRSEDVQKSIPSIPKY